MSLGHECQEHHFLNKSEMASRVPHGAGTRPSVPERQTSRDGKELILRWCSREMNSWGRESETLPRKAILPACPSLPSAGTLHARPLYELYTCCPPAPAFLTDTQRLSSGHRVQDGSYRGSDYLYQFVNQFCPPSDGGCLQDCCFF